MKIDASAVLSVGKFANEPLSNGPANSACARSLPACVSLLNSVSDETAR